MKILIATAGTAALALLGAMLVVVTPTLARPAPRPVASPGAVSAAVEITIDNFTFGQARVTVERGTKVTWRNRDDMPHTVVSTDKKFESRVLDTGDRFSYTFDTPGTFAYYCSLHPRMTGTVIVR